MNQDRERFYSEAKSKGYKLISYVSSRAMLCDNKIGENCFILGGVTLQPFVEIGNNGARTLQVPHGRRSIVLVLSIWTAQAHHRLLARSPRQQLFGLLDIGARTRFLIHGCVLRPFVLPLFTSAAKSTSKL